MVGVVAERTAARLGRSGEPETSMRGCAARKHRGKFGPQRHACVLKQGQDASGGVVDRMSISAWQDRNRERASFGILVGDGPSRFGRNFAAQPIWAFPSRSGRRRQQFWSEVRTILAPNFGPALPHLCRAPSRADPPDTPKGKMCRRVYMRCPSRIFGVLVCKHIQTTWRQQAGAALRVTRLTTESWADYHGRCAEYLRTPQVEAPRRA